MFRQHSFAMTISMFIILLMGSNTIYDGFFGAQKKNHVNYTPDRFTGSTKKWVNKLENEIESLKETYKRNVDTLSIKISSDSFPQKIEDSFSSKIRNTMEKIGYLIKVQWEIECLRKSNQVYSVIENNNLNGEGFTAFNFNTGQVNIYINSEERIGIFAHELLHAYQFDRGLNSLGEVDSSGGKFLLDSADERASYERQERFGAPRDTSKGKGRELPQGPNSIYNFRRDTGMYRVDLPDSIAKRRIEGLKNVAFRMNQAFRVQIDGKWMTIRPK